METVAGWLTDRSGLTPHGFCLLWQPGLLWTHALADVTIGLAYFSIPVTLSVFVRRRADLGFRPVLVLFASFILLCGAGHLIDVATLWIPVYGLSAVVKVATALASIVTAVIVWRLMPAALAVPSPEQLRDANAALAKLAEQRGVIADTLRASEARHQSGMLHSPMCLHELDANGVVVAASEHWLELLGYCAADVVGRSITSFLAPEDAARFPADWAQLRASGELRDLERRFVRRDRTLLDALVSSRVEPGDGSGPYRVLGALVDVTERRRTEAALRASEERLHRAQKMDSLGQLTGGVAHDFNNVLQAVVGGLELMRERVGATQPELTVLADRTLQAAGRATRLTAQLLSFARRQRLEPQSLEVPAVLNEMQTLLERSLTQDIRLTVISDPDVHLCLADRAQLEAALLNITINARDAILAREPEPGTGQLTFVISNEWLPPAGTQDSTQLEGDFVRITATDDGAGMAEAVRRRAFEPFFSTKPPGQGTGLGLSQLHGFVHQSGGTVTLVSRPGEGTTVSLLLPRAHQAMVGEIRESRRDAPPPRHSGARDRRVLLVDDDSLVRMVLGDVLRDRGYEPVEADGPHAALAELGAGPPPAAVVTDLAMPGGMDGLAFAQEVRRRFRGLPVVIMSGHLDPLRGRDVPPDVAFLQKPFDAQRLDETLDTLLQPSPDPILAVGD